MSYGDMQGSWERPNALWSQESKRMKDPLNSWLHWHLKEESKHKSDKDTEPVDNCSRPTVSPRDGLNRSLLWLLSHVLITHVSVSVIKALCHTFYAHLPNKALTAGQAWGHRPAVPKASSCETKASAWSLADVGLGSINFWDPRGCKLTLTNPLEPLCH